MTAAVVKVDRAPPAPKPAHKLIVASKLPMTVQLQLCVFREVVRRLRETSWTESEAAKVGEVVFIRGTSHPRGQAPEGFRDPPTMVGGYALTFGVDGEWWREWLKQNKDTEMVRNNVIFAAATRDEIVKRARGEFSAVRSGLDPIVPPPKEGQKGEVDPRLPAPIKGITFAGEAGPTDADG